MNREKWQTLKTEIISACNVYNICAKNVVKYSIVAVLMKCAAHTHRLIFI